MILLTLIAAYAQVLGRALKQWTEAREAREQAVWDACLLTKWKQ